VDRWVFGHVILKEYNMTKLKYSHLLCNMHANFKIHYIEFKLIFILLPIHVIDIESLCQILILIQYFKIALMYNLCGNLYKILKVINGFYIRVLIHSVKILVNLLQCIL